MIDGLTDLAIEFEHDARPELEQFADIHAGPAKHGGDLHRYVEDGFQIGSVDRVAPSSSGDEVARSGGIVPPPSRLGSGKPAVVSHVFLLQTSNIERRGTVDCAGAADVSASSLL